MKKNSVAVQLLGQSGCRLSFPGATVYVDPYLSHSVQELDSADLKRQVPIQVSPDDIRDAAWVLITHEHIDHCDPQTLPKIAAASPDACFIGPYPVVCKLKEWGIDSDRIQIANEGWCDLSPDLRIRAVPAAHPEIERDIKGNLSCIGYLLEWAGKRIYLAGDTFVRQEIIDTLKLEGSIHTAFLPVNEHNFFRNRRGIIGNMTVREAFQLATEIGVKQVVPVHWDMFADNAVDPDEIRLIHRQMNPGFSLIFKPAEINLVDVQISLIIRTLNEAVHLNELLESIALQQTDGLGFEVVLVDSGSTDGTLAIAERHGCRIHHINRKEFSFGRSLNIGCEAAHGDVFVIISGHCVPTSAHWLKTLCQPLLEGAVDYTYGRQYGGLDSHFSECRIFSKYFPEQSSVPQQGGFCNNANAALTRRAWEIFHFDEVLTGLEDMELAKRLLADGGSVAYLADAGVFHYHNESWFQIKRRFEREAIALPAIMPQIYMRRRDLLRYIGTSIWKDWLSALKQGVWREHALDIIRYRFCQYWGSFKGNHVHRELSHAEKEKYFFPN